MKKYCAEKQLNGENFLPSNVALNKNQMNCLPTIYQQLYAVSVMASTTRVCEATLNTNLIFTHFPCDMENRFKHNYLREEKLNATEICVGIMQRWVPNVNIMNKHSINIYKIWSRWNLDHHKRLSGGLDRLCILYYALGNLFWVCSLESVW